MELLDGTNHMIKEIYNPEEDICSVYLGDIGFIKIKFGKGEIFHIRADSVSMLNVFKGEI